MLDGCLRIKCSIAKALSLFPPTLSTAYTENIGFNDNHFKIYRNPINYGEIGFKYLIFQTKHLFWI